MRIVAQLMNPGMTLAASSNGSEERAISLVLLARTRGFVGAPAPIRDLWQFLIAASE